MRQVALGQHHEDLVVVNSGVKAGERVVTAGQMKIPSAGTVVRLEAAAPPTTAPAAAQASSGSTSERVTGGGQ
jgi:hypothetical protein